MKTSLIFLNGYVPTPNIPDFKGLIIDKNNLKIPHEKCHLRNFVLFPICQIDPSWKHPIFKKKAKYAQALDLTENFIGNLAKPT